MHRFQAMVRRTSKLAFAMGIVLGVQAVAAAQSSNPRHAPASIPARPASVGVADPGSLWPGGIVYYDDQGCIAANTCPNLAQAVNTFNTDFSGGVEWNERATQTTYVFITLSGTGGQGEVNTIGYPSTPGQVALQSCSRSASCLLLQRFHAIESRFSK